MDERDATAAYARYFPIIRGKCSRMVRDGAIAQDLAQETFTRLWAHRAELHSPEATVAWVYRTATRLAIDHFRASRRTDDHIDELPSQDRPDRTAEARRLLELLARELDEQELEAIVLTRVDGMTQPEAAQVLAVSERTVRRLLERADERLSRWRAEA